MREIIGSILKRELKIIEFLYKNRGFHPIEDLIEILGVTEKTIQADINRINKKFSLLRIETSLKSQIKLECADSVGLEYVYRKIMEESIELKFFEYLLIEPNCPINFYEEKLFVSKSSIQRIVRKWNEVFEKKGLNISISTIRVLKIKGDEKLIRQLYSHYLLEKYGGDFQHKFVEIDSAWKLIQYIGKALSINIPYSNHLKLTYWIYVCIKRMKHGFFMSPNICGIEGYETARFLYNEISKEFFFTEQFMRDYQIKLSVEVLLDIIGTFNCDLLVLGHFTREITSYKEKEMGLSMLALKGFLLSLYKSIQYENTSLEQTLTDIYSSLIFQFQITFFFYNQYEEFKAYVMRENPRFLKIFEEHLKKSNLPNYLKENNDWNDEFLYDVIIYSKLILEKIPALNDSKKLLILTTFDGDYELLLKEKIKNKFAGRVSISIYNSDQLQFDIKYMEKFDVILTNYTQLPENLENRIIFLDIGMSNIFLRKIEDKLEHGSK